MARISKKDLEERCERLSHEATIAQQAVIELVDENVKWFRKKNLKVGVLRPLSPHGGIVIVRWKLPTNDTTCEYYAEEWVNYVMQDHYIPDHKEEKVEFETRRVVAQEVQTYLRETQKAAG